MSVKLGQMQLAVSTSWKYKSYLKLKILRGNAQLVYRSGKTKYFSGVVCALVVNQNFWLIFIVQDFFFMAICFSPIDSAQFLHQEEGKILFFS